MVCDMEPDFVSTSTFPPTLVMMELSVIPLYPSLVILTWLLFSSISRIFPPPAAAGASLRMTLLFPPDFNFISFICRSGVFLSDIVRLCPLGCFNTKESGK